MSEVADILKSRDQALSSLDDAIDEITNEIAITTANNFYLRHLTKQCQDLVNQKTAILDATDQRILNLPQVIKAYNQLNALSLDMKATAEELPAATDALAKTSEILTLGQQYVNLIANAQKAAG